MTKMSRKRNRKTPDRPASLLGRLAAAVGLRPEDEPQRGSALLATLMVITGLTLLGLAFVAITQTESAISMNEKNYTQTLQIAEAAALRGVDWFQNPQWALDQKLLPMNNNSFKVERRLFIGLGNVYIGRYKSVGGDLLFDKPFRSQDNRHRFYGTEDNPDVWINSTTSANAGPVPGLTPSRDFLTNFNIALFNTNAGASVVTMDNREGGVVTDIRIYAPEVEGANVNTQAGWTTTASGATAAGTGFVEGGTRFGVATVRMTATKFEPPCTAFPCTGRAVATRTVKISVTEWPFPGPQGPVQTNANLNTSGNIQIHWGRTTASGDMTMSKTFVGIPWAHAYDLAHFEHGYDPIYPTGTTTHTWPRIATADAVDASNYLAELVGRRYEDPWWEMRARGDLNVKASTNPIPYPYVYGNNPTVNRSNWFQFQNQSSYPTQKNILFPRIDYNFWKQVAQSADDEANIYYLNWVSGDQFRDKSGNVRTVRQWIDVTSAPPANTGPKSVPGFFFFETENAINPQNNGGGTLTPDIDFKGGSMQAKGFWYFNSESFGSQGLGGVTEWVNMPGEPFRDIGYLVVEEDSTNPDYKDYAREDQTGPACTPTTGAAGLANCKVFGRGNSQWDYQDLVWSRGGSAKNDMFDVKVMPAGVAATRNGGVAIPANDRWKPLGYTDGCDPGVDCSEPHEPYLNLIYPTIPLGGPIADWHDPSQLSTTLAGAAGTATRRAKRLTSAGNPEACVAESTVVTVATIIEDRKKCTSNSYDRDGGMVQLGNSFNGVLYNEGEFYATGGAVYFGSVLAQGNAAKAGQPDIYFDERLVKDQWPPGNFGFPRVYVSAQQTDQ